MSILLAAVAFAASGANAEHGTAAAPCDILNARYVAAGEPRYRLTVARLASTKEVMSDIALHIEPSSAKGEIWYYLDQGSRPRIWLISTTNPTAKGWQAVPDGGNRPYGSATLIAMTKDGRILDAAPKSTSAAPHFIIVPELAEIYRDVEHGYRPAAFVLAGCNSQKGPARK
jgi:hypothetical protein